MRPREHARTHKGDLESVAQSEVLKEGVLGVTLPFSTFQINSGRNEAWLQGFTGGCVFFFFS